MDDEIFELGDVTLQFAVTLPHALLAYKTYGTLNAHKSNVIVYPTWYSGQHSDNEWLIGHGMALDPHKYFLIVPNLLGNGLSSSPSNTPPPFDKARFPPVTIYDNVQVQHQLVTQKFGIEKVALVTGWSMGAQHFPFPLKTASMSPISCPTPSFVASSRYEDTLLVLESIRLTRNALTRVSKKCCPNKQLLLHRG